MIIVTLNVTIDIFRIKVCMDESYDFQGLLLHISFIYAMKRALQIFGSASLGCKDLPLERMGRLHEK